MHYSILIKAFIGFVLLASWLGVERYEQKQASLAMTVTDGAAFELINTHCAVCHSQIPTQPGFVAAPAGMLMDDQSQVLQSASQILTAVQTGYMPLGNMTGMTVDERTKLISWLEKKVNP